MRRPSAGPLRDGGDRPLVWRNMFLAFDPYRQMLTHALRSMASGIFYCLAAIAMPGLAASAPASEPVPAAEQIDATETAWRAMLIQLQEAFARHDYEAAYRIIRAQPDVDDDAEAMSSLGGLLLNLEMLAAHDHSSDKWYRPDLMGRLAPDERMRVGMDWIRRAAYLGSETALRDVAHAYRVGAYGYPFDTKAGDCFKAARTDTSKIPTCREIEQARGYVPGARRQREPPDR